MCCHREKQELWLYQGLCRPSREYRSSLHLKNALWSCPNTGFQPKTQKWVAITMRGIFKMWGGLQRGPQASRISQRASATPGKSGGVPVSLGTSTIAHHHTANTRFQILPASLKTFTLLQLNRDPHLHAESGVTANCGGHMKSLWWSAITETDLIVCPTPLPQSNSWFYCLFFVFCFYKKGLCVCSTRSEWANFSQGKSYTDTEWLTNIMRTKTMVYPFPYLTTNSSNSRPGSIGTSDAAQHPLKGKKNPLCYLIPVPWSPW